MDLSPLQTGKDPIQGRYGTLWNSITDELRLTSEVRSVLTIAFQRNSEVAN